MTQIFVDYFAWPDGLEADGVPEVSDDGQGVAVGEAADGSAVHLQEHVAWAWRLPGEKHRTGPSSASLGQRRQAGPEVGELASLGAAPQEVRVRTAASPPRHGALLHLAQPVPLPPQRLRHEAAAPSRAPQSGPRGANGTNRRPTD